MKRAFVFPGQGSQASGMGKELAEAFSAARLLFEEVDDALSQHLSRLMFEGPEPDLMLTENAQPALLAASMAVIRVLEAEAGFDPTSQIAYVAGHSLGEYSALAAARTFAVGDAVRLVKRRGQAMQKAVPVGEGAMAALLGLDIDAAREVAEEAAGDGVCDVANDNCPGQVVVSGSAEAVNRAVSLASARGSRPRLLPVSAPFHCKLMAPAADVMAEALADTRLNPPLVPVVANVSATATEDVDVIRTLLVEQVTSMVRWRETVLLFRLNEVEEIVEIGAGKVLAGLSRRIDREMAVVSAGSAAETEELMKRL
ncbi:MAG TPA: ACP S-malonyltransferase [Stellaceae bacterium]|nr:ACP S-malonyltransferase [Stellaceae bacterium]